MNEAELRKIVALIVEAITEETQPKRALVLFTGALICCAEGGEAMKRLMAAGVELEYVQTPSAKNVLNQEKIKALGIREAGPHLIANNDVLVIPTLTANTVAKAAHGIADGVASNLIMEFLMHGKQVVAASNAADPDSPQKKAFFPKMPAAQAALLRSNLAKVSALGVQLADVTCLDKAVLKAFGLGTSVSDATVIPASQPSAQASPSQATTHCLKLISAQGVQGLPIGSTLKISQGAVVTALARDFASARSIRIERV